MDSQIMKRKIFNHSTKETEIIYYTEEELAEIKAKEEQETLENALVPSEEDIKDAEFELKLLNKLTDWGII